MTFKPSIGLKGLRVTASFDIEAFKCENLDSNIYQLAIILYPAELFNERLLLNVRNCLPNLPNEHPAKLWISSQRKKIKPTPIEQEKTDLVISVLESQFNLITDLKMITSVINLIAEMPEVTGAEKLIKSYLYLIIGNTARSDNLLKDIIQEPPRKLFQGFESGGSLYHKIGTNNLEKILQKFARHPADRLTFYLLCEYFKSFFNETQLSGVIDEFDFDEVKEKLSLAYTAQIAPDLVNYLRLAKMKEERRIEKLRSGEYSLKMQSQWIWNFLDIDPLISDNMVETLRELEKSDPLWLIYILSNEKISDMYFKKGGQPISRRRQFLRAHLENNADFMMTLYKLIEIGDIDQDLVKKVSKFMIYE